MAMTADQAAAAIAAGHTVDVVQRATTPPTNGTGAPPPAVPTKAAICQTCPLMPTAPGPQVHPPAPQIVVPQFAVAHQATTWGKVWGASRTLGTRALWIIVISVVLSYWFRPPVAQAVDSLNGTQPTTPSASITNTGPGMLIVRDTRSIYLTATATAAERAWAFAQQQSEGWNVVPVDRLPTVALPAEQLIPTPQTAVHHCSEEVITRLQTAETQALQLRQDYAGLLVGSERERYGDHIRTISEALQYARGHSNQRGE